jgi:ribosomal protein S18 acetylase RimI-like enzyme
MVDIQQLNEYNLNKLIEFWERNKKDAHLFNPHPFTEVYLKHIINTCVKDVYKLFLLYDIVIGYGLLRGWDEGYSIPSLGIEVDKDYRGRGLSITFMNILHDIAKEAGADKVRLTVMKNNIIARKLYEKLGYKFHPYKEDRDEGILDL